MRKCKSRVKKVRTVPLMSTSICNTFLLEPLIQSQKILRSIKRHMAKSGWIIETLEIKKPYFKGDLCVYSISGWNGKRKWSPWAYFIKEF